MTSLCKRAEAHGCGQLLNIRARVLTIGERDTCERLERHFRSPAPDARQCDQQSHLEFVHLDDQPKLRETLTASADQWALLFIDGDSMPSFQAVHLMANALTVEASFLVLVAVKRIGAEWRMALEQLQWSNRVFAIESSPEAASEAQTARRLIEKWCCSSQAGHGAELGENDTEVDRNRQIGEADEAFDTEDTQRQPAPAFVGHESSDEAAYSETAPTLEEVGEAPVPAMPPMHQARALEAVGQLASGVAHEINTPVQFVSDSVFFLQEAFEAFAELFSSHQELLDEMVDGPEVRRHWKHISRNHDLDYFLESAPGALRRAVEGLEQVSDLVRALKDFAPRANQHAKNPADLHRSLTNAATVSRNHYKYVAELELDLEPVPHVPCYVTELNQVFLNLIINATDAIAERFEGSGQMGTIKVSCWQEANEAVVTIEDNGSGISPETQDRIFDPFFTTKPVGKGTGQGLAIAWATVVDGHGGQLSFESTVGEGTTFTVRLPLD
jgi:signal transduction histidine kinase